MGLFSNNPILLCCCVGFLSFILLPSQKDLSERLALLYLFSFEDSLRYRFSFFFVIFLLVNYGFLTTYKKHKQTDSKSKCKVEKQTNKQFINQTN